MQYTLREEGSTGICGVLTSESNELQAGCIIDIGGGVCLTYTPDQQHQEDSSSLSSLMEIDPEPTTTPLTHTHTLALTQDPNHFIARLNDSKPVCPVLMNTLHFPLRLPAQRHALARLHTLRAAGMDSGFVACQHPGSSAAGQQQPATQLLMADG
jgi:hypothetical protein